MVTCDHVIFNANKRIIMMPIKNNSLKAQITAFFKVFFNQDIRYLLLDSITLHTLSGLQYSTANINFTHTGKPPPKLSDSHVCNICFYCCDLEPNLQYLWEVS